MGLAVDTDDRPAVLLSDYRLRRARLTLRRTDKLGRPGRSVTVARSINSIGGEGLFAGRGGDLVAGWLEIVNGSRRPVVATGPRLADRQMLAPGPRSTQFMDIVANRRGDAVVAFWRYAPATSTRSSLRTAAPAAGSERLSSLRQAWSAIRRWRSTNEVLPWCRGRTTPASPLPSDQPRPRRSAPRSRSLRRPGPTVVRAWRSRTAA
jgi:hypothetical protein